MIHAWLSVCINSKRIKELLLGINIWTTFWEQTKISTFEQIRCYCKSTWGYWWLVLAQTTQLGYEGDINQSPIIAVSLALNFAGQHRNLFRAAHFYLRYYNDSSNRSGGWGYERNGQLHNACSSSLLGYNQCVTSRNEISSSNSICSFQSFQWYLHKVKQSCLI